MNEVSVRQVNKEPTTCGPDVHYSCEMRPEMRRSGTEGGRKTESRVGRRGDGNQVRRTGLAGPGRR